MLGKLTKHEFLSVGRIALPSYIIVLALALVGRILTWFTSRQYVIEHVPETFVKIIKVLSSLISTVYVLVFLSLLVLTLLMMVYRFYKNFFTDEGYLMLTLPVRTSSLIFSKLFNAWIWVFFSIIIAGLSLVITLGHYDELSGALKDIWDGLQTVMEREGDFLRDELGVPLWVFGVELLIFVFAYITRFILSWYSSVSFGILISKRHKILGTLLAYFVLFIVTVIINAIYFTVITTVVPDYSTIITESTGKALQIVLIGSIVIHILFSAGLYGITAYILKHRVNLD